MTPTEPAAASAGAPASVVAVARVGWADLAKGVCIVLVVLWHVVTKHVQALEWGPSAPAASLWGLVGAQLLPLRMPLFFLVSGLFAARVVLRSDPGDGARRGWSSRSLGLLLLYALWLAIQTAALAVLAPDVDTARAHDIGEFLAQLTVSPTNLWYLQALALYLLVGRVTRGIPTAAVLVTAFLVSAVAGAGLLADTGNSWQVAQNAFFFLLGVRMRDHVVRITATVRVPVALLACAVFMAGVVAVGLLGIRAAFGVWPLLCVLAVVAGVLVCASLDRRLPRVTAPLRWIGRRTLPVYVIHMIPLAVADRLLRESPVVPALPGAVIWEPLVLTAFVIAVSLVVHTALRRVARGALFDPLVLWKPVSPAGREHPRQVR